MNKDKIIIVHSNQFGYNIDFYKYAEGLGEKYDLIYICRDEKRKKINSETVKIKYFKKLIPTRLDNIFFIFAAIYAIFRIKPELIFIKYFELSSLIGLFFRQKVVLDIRTSSVRKKKFIRFLENNILKFETIFFNQLTIISKGLGGILKLNPAKVHVLPLGGIEYCFNEKKYEKLKLLYVGTLYNRKIEETIIGFNRFIQKYNMHDITYTIISKEKELAEKLIQFVSDKNIDENIVISGPKYYEDLVQYFEHSNVGISFIPITEYFNHQPPTKTFDYIISGLICIGTRTSENIKIINANNGVLCNDNSDDFCEAIYKVHSNRLSYSYNILRHTQDDYTWDNIINSNLLPLFKKLLRK